MNKLLLSIFFLCIHFLAAQETYLDNFSTISYANNDGTSNWAGNWIEANDDNSPSGGFIRITGNRLRFFRIGNEIISRTADLTGAATATLSFDWETDNIESNEELLIQVSSDGINFDTLDSFTGTTTGTFSEDISAYISANTTIRFLDPDTTVWTSTGDIAEFDNIQIATTDPDQPPVIIVTGDQTFCNNSTNSIPVAEAVSITDPDDTTLEQVTVQISTGYQNGQDLLTLTGSHPSITDTWNVVEGRLTLAGPATLAEFEAAVLAVTFSSTPPVILGIREFSIVLATPLYLPETDHFYEFVPNTGIRWDDARDAAALRTLFGLQGYMATLTSQIEADFAGDQITGTGWIGASDNFGSGEGDWRWETGPEAGTSFWIGDETGNVVPGEFAFWNNNEPNDFPDDGIDGQENYAHITDNSVGIQNSWNDLPIGGGGGAFAAQGYIVEYGGTSGDPTLQISGVTKLRISCSVITNRNKTYRVKPRD